MSVHIIKPGMLTTLQDRGRRGHAGSGVGRSGPMDINLARLANALAGNADADAALLEITVTGPKLQVGHRCRLALTGGFQRARIDGRPVAAWRPLLAEAGAEIDCGPMSTGTRGYLAVDGGFAVAPVLDSRSSDVNGRLGPFGGRALLAGDELPLGTTAPFAAAASNWSLDPAPWFDVDAGQPIHCMAGRDYAALDDASQRALVHAEFRIGSDSNRVGLRLDGALLRFRAPRERISEPVTFGTVQLPPAGQPIVLMAEHPTTGGYPCIAQVAAIDLGRLAQRRPGDRMRFALTGYDEAQARYRRQQRELDALVRSIHERLQP